MKKHITQGLSSFIGCYVVLSVILSNSILGCIIQQAEGVLGISLLMLLLSSLLATLLGLSAEIGVLLLLFLFFLLFNT